MYKKMDQEEKLIELVKKNELIYNPVSKDYKNMRLKKQKWEEIATVMALSVEICKKKWKNLRDSFIRLCRSRSVKGKLEQGFEHEIQWRYYEPLNFLNSIILVNKSISIDKSTEGEDVKSDEEEFSFNLFEEHVPLTPVPVHDFHFPDELSVSSRTKGKKRKKDDKLKSAFVNMLDNINKYIKLETEANTVQQQNDEDELFCRTITAKIKSLPNKKIKNHVKCEIYSLICKIENKEQ